MDHTEMVGAANQIHACVEHLQARCGVPTFAREARQSLPKGSIQVFDKGGIENLSPTRTCQQLLCPLKQPMGHPAGNLDHMFFLGPLDGRSNVQVWPDM